MEKYRLFLRAQTGEPNYLEAKSTKYQFNILDIYICPKCGDNTYYLFSPLEKQRYELYTTYKAVCGTCDYEDFISIRN